MAKMTIVRERKPLTKPLIREALGEVGIRLTEGNPYTYMADWVSLVDRMYNLFEGAQINTFRVEEDEKKDKSK